MIESLRQIEAAKRKHHPGTPEFLWYAERVEELSKVILGLSASEKRAAERADRQPGASPVTVEETPPASIPELLERWRDAERQLAACASDAPERRELELEVERARHLYRQTVENAARPTSGSG